MFEFDWILKETRWEKINKWRIYRRKCGFCCSRKVDHYAFVDRIFANFIIKCNILQVLLDDTCDIFLYIVFPVQWEISNVDGTMNILDWLTPFL